MKRKTTAETFERWYRKQPKEFKDFAGHFDIGELAYAWREGYRFGVLRGKRSK